jgi:chromate transporter
LIIAALLKNFRDNKYVNNAFYGLRPASTGLIGAACVAVILEVLTSVIVLSEGRIFNAFQLGEGSILHLPKLALAALLLILTNWVKPVKNWHPIVFIALSAVVGILFGFTGA